MKVNKTITLDMDLVLELNKLNINVSEECNIHLWTLINNNQSIVKQTKNLDAEIDKLTAEKEAIEKETAQKQARGVVGIDDKMLLFLKGMNTNTACIKDNKQAWLNLTGQIVDWQTLQKLKRDWT